MFVPFTVIQTSVLLIPGFFFGASPPILACPQSGGGWDAEHHVNGGFRAYGFGFSLAAVGDVNQDSIPDYAVGSPQATYQDQGQTGAVYLVSGVDGEYLQILYGSSADARFGHSVAALGDLNQDGVTDFAVGEPGYDLMDGEDLIPDVGRVQIFSGANGNRLAQHVGENGGDRFGLAVGNAGDVDRSGKCDLIFAGSAQAGAKLFADRSQRLLAAFEGSWTAVGGMVFDRGSGDSIPVLSSKVQDRTLVWDFDGERPLQEFPGGLDFADAGDLDLDGFGDLLVGDDPCRIWSGATGDLLLSVHGQGRAGFGQSVCLLDRLDAFGLPTFAVAAPQNQDLNRESAGSVFLFSSSNGEQLEIYSAGRSFSYLGSGMVAGSGDAELIVGDPGPSSPKMAGDYRPGKIMFLNPRPWIFCPLDQVSMEAGGLILFDFNFPDSEHGTEKVVLLSYSGPGVTEIGSLQIPLATDPMLMNCLNGNYPEDFFGGRGPLDENGDGSAFFRWWPGLHGGMVGRSLGCAAFSFDPGSGPRRASQAAYVEILP